MRFYYHAAPEALERIRQVGFRDVRYLVEGKEGVWLCSHNVHGRAGHEVLIVDLPPEVLRGEWRTFCAKDARASDWVIPAAVLALHGVLAGS